MRNLPAKVLLVFLLSGFAALPAFATIFGAMRGVVRDAQDRPIAGAAVVLQSNSADWSQSAVSDAAGEFAFRSVPLGEYSVTVRAPNFSPSRQGVTVHSGSTPVLRFVLAPAGPSETVTVSGEPSPAEPSGLTSTVTLVDRAEIAATPGASRPNSLATITDFVPGAYITHSQLHIRGGHQTDWLIDGVPVPNTNIDSNLGPQFPPGDMDYMEIHRGAYGAEFGNRAYGVFNIVPRTGFERSREGELVVSAGNFYQTNDQLSFGSHSERWAYYASVNGNRSNLGIQTPAPQVVHDAENGYGGCGSLIYNRSASDQLRWLGSARHDFYQIPYDPNPNDFENSDPNSRSIGLRDGDSESDVLLNSSWVHTFSSRWILTLSPVYHYNRAAYESSPHDTPVAVTQERSSNYAGGQATLEATLPMNQVQAGLYGFYQADSELFGANASLSGPDHPTGRMLSLFLDDKFRPASWLTLTAGFRPTFYDGGVSESALSPRFGVAVTLPGLHWTLRGFYGHYYQAPPLITISGPLVQFVTSQNLTFVPLRGERDEEFQFGLTIPFRGWTLDADTFRNRVANFFDHNNIGESNLSFPITVQSALVRAWELTLRSPRIAGRAQIHLAYSNQIAEAGGTITGGLENPGPICDAGPAALCPLDHDQRNTLNVGGDVRLPWRAHAAANVYYGSGFTNGEPDQQFPGAYLPAHTSVDLSLGKDVGMHYSFSATVLNVANRRVELDNSLAFGGFHWNAPREFFGQMRYRFPY